MEKRDVKFGEWFEAGFNLFQANALVLILASLVAMVLTGVTSGVLGGPMAAGMVVILRALQAKTEPKPEVGDVFKGFQFFVPSFLMSLLVGIATIVVWTILVIVPCLGPILMAIYAIMVNALVMFAIFFIVDKNMDCIAALKAGFEVVKSNLWSFVAFSIVVMAIGGVGSILCGFGAIITVPIALCIVAVAYDDVIGGGAIEAEATDITEEVDADAEPVDESDDDKVAE